MSKNIQRVEGAKVFYVRGGYKKGIVANGIRTALELIYSGAIELKESKPSLNRSVGCNV